MAVAGVFLLLIIALPMATAAVVLFAITGLAVNGAVLILSRGRWARMGLLGAAAFLVAIIPLGLYTLADPVLAAGALYLARRAWPLAALARSATRPPGPTATPAHRCAQPDQPARPLRLP
ncbi:hypothetical protein ACVGVM_12210 [Pseudonocardia bannensis]|uniref:Uncharacterized protein n=1 Tax=Pseudonocardia bannensis TaxID=630973 RepID=A0A848DF28_9PSEU|nr:hypothetical protein [Pseudonocardia bannensis]NMH91230.1 hypothetical protein [Pseudonocardia bannensis]